MLDKIVLKRRCWLWNHKFELMLTRQENHLDIYEASHAALTLSIWQQFSLAMQETSQLLDGRRMQYLSQYKKQSLNGWRMQYLSQYKKNLLNSTIHRLTLAMHWSLELVAFKIRLVRNSNHLSQHCSQPFGITDLLYSSIINLTLMQFDAISAFALMMWAFITVNCVSYPTPFKLINMLYHH